MPRIVDSIEVAAPPGRVYDFCTDCRNLPALFPADVRVEVVRHPIPPLKTGDEIALRFHRGGLVYPWESVITDLDAGRYFEDAQVRGPMRRWVSAHVFEPTAQGTRVRHIIEYSFHMGPLGRLCGIMFVDRVLRHVFQHVHRATKDAIEVAWRRG
ncbi:MAG: SRPBCC family protein [Armatimonadetes bacterium]|nr:SRPBCC family protein [Armatimonadota bacterium]